MKRRTLLTALACVALSVGGGWTYLKLSAGASMTSSAEKFVASLTDDQKDVALIEYGSPLRVDWHFIPKSERKGLQVKHMTESQRKAAFDLLRSSLSQIGYDKATQIMALEGVLAELEKDRTGGAIRDTERYYFTIFGTPDQQKKWGLSIEGHHLSLNFVVENDQVVATTPTFFAANPATVMAVVPNTDVKKGTRVLAKEEQLAFDLVQSLNDEQLKTALLSPEAPREIRAAGQPQAPREPAAGLPADKLGDDQRAVLNKLIAAYASNVPDEIAKQRMSEIEQSGPSALHFAWAGARKPGVGHYYRIQGPTFLIEFVNTQPDAAGNPANHIHCVWRDPRGDFSIPVN